MKMFNQIILTCLLTACLAVTAQGADTPLGEVLQKLDVHAAPGDLEHAPIPGFLEVIRGTRILYVSQDGKLLIRGDILAVATETNLTERRRGVIRTEMLKTIPIDQRIVAPVHGPVRARVVVFADTNCPYCLKLHRQHAEFASRGIEVQYLFYPRSGPGSESFAQAVAVWCSADRLAALDAALGGAILPAADCENPVMAHYELARELDLRGTPAVITDDGSMRYGVLKPNELLTAGNRPQS